MKSTGLILSALLMAVLLCSGCGASIELQRGDIELDQLFDTSKFYLRIEDGSESKPDNWDGHVNLIWTDEKKRAVVVADHIQLLKTELEKSGFVFVDNTDKSSVIANLKFKSVRYDPVGGWLTDDAKIEYTTTLDGESLGTVVADEIWITPTIKMVFEALVKGSVELWGQSSGE